MIKPYIFSLSLALIACQIPPTSQIKPEPILSGQVEFPQPQTFQTQAVIPANQTTLTLIYPPGHAQAGETITTGLTDHNGQFSLTRPEDFTPAAGSVYKLMAHKRAGRGGHDQLSLSTFVRRLGDRWESITGSDVILNSTTTALTIIDQQDTNLHPSDLINSVSFTASTAQATAVGSTTLSTIQEVQRLTHFLLAQGYDPQQFIHYANGHYYPAQPLSLTAQVLRDTGRCPECDLSFLNLSGQNLYLAYLWGANLQGSNLSSSNLNYANLSHADLQNANLRQANLNQANLSQAKIDQADLSLATWFDGQSCVEGSIGYCDYDIRLNPNAGTENGPDISQDDVGNTFFVWHQSATGLNPQIWGRYYDPSGIPKAAPFRLDNSSFSKSSPHVKIHNNGNSVVVWDSHAQDGDNSGVFARLFGPDGSPRSPEFQVNQTSASSQSNSQVFMDQQGNFVVSWHHYQSPYYDIYARRFDANGQPLGPEFRVNETTPENQYFPSISGTPNGEFIIIWLDANFNPPQVVGRSFDADGTPKGASYQVSQTWGSHNSLSINDQGQVIAVWIEPIFNGVTSIKARRWNMLTTPNSPEFQINNPVYSPANYYRPEVSLNSTGEYIVTWAGLQTNTRPPANINDSYMRPFNANNQALSDQQTVFHMRGGPEIMAVSLGKQGQLWLSACLYDFTFQERHVYARRRLFEQFY